MQYSVSAILVLTTAIAIEFQSRFMLNVGISVTFITLMITLPSVCSNWPLRKTLSEADLKDLRRCVTATVCGTLNTLLITVVFLAGELPAGWTY